MGSGTAQSFSETSNSTSSALAKLQHDVSESGVARDCSCQCHGGKPSRGVHRGHKRSRSHTTLRTGISELPAWDLDFSTPEPAAEVAKPSVPGGSSFERLPIEVLGM